MPNGPDALRAPRSRATERWLTEALRDLEEILEGREALWGIPSAKAASASRDLLRWLATRRIRVPVIGELPRGGISIEYPGHGQTRLTIAIQADGGVRYHELIDGKRRRERFWNWTEMTSAISPDRFRKAALGRRRAMEGEPGLLRQRAVVRQANPEGPERTMASGSPGNGHSARDSRRHSITR